MRISLGGPVQNMSTAQFYTDLASYYDLIYADWQESMARQGEALARVIRTYLRPEHRAAPRVLDAAAGIGTQTLPLAAHGFRVTARDISPGAIARLRHEVTQRQLRVDVGVGDMRSVASTVTGPFDAVICCDNALPHLLSDDVIAAAFRQFRAVVADGGICVCSVRDYDAIRRLAPEGHDYGERRRGPSTFHLRQEWTWRGRTHYDTTFVVEERLASDTCERVRVTSRYYAVAIARLLELMADAGFVECVRIDDAFFQPIVLGRRAT